MSSRTKYTRYLTLLTQVFDNIRSIKVTLKTLFLFCTLLTISFFTNHSFAQFTYELDKTTRFEKMGAEEGLSTGYVYCIHQDKYGFIWIGTQYGLNLYDGYEVKVFYANPKNTHSICNNYIQSIYEEPDGTMWFCTNMGMSKYNRANQTFCNYIPDTLNLASNRNYTQKILQDGDQLWVDVWNGLVRFNKETGQFKSFTEDTLSRPNSIVDKNSNYIFIDGAGVLWVASGENEDDFTLSKFNKETNTFDHFKNDPSNPESFAGKMVMSMAEDQEGTLWAATLGGGLLEITDKEKGKFKQYVNNKNDKYSIIHNYLLKIFIDSTGNIWTGGVNGFSQLNKTTGRFTNYQIPNRTDFPNRPNVIYDINEGINSELWLSTRGGLFRFTPSQVLSHYIHDPEDPISIADNLVFQVIKDGTGQTWIVLPNQSINRINRFSNAFRRIQKKVHITNSLSSNFILNFLKDSRGNFWVGCFGGGLNRTKIKKHQDYDNFDHFVFDADDPQSISGNRIQAIYEDQDKIIWFGTFWGLNSYDYRTNKFKRFQHDPDNNTTISSNMVESIFEDSYGTFWVGTRTGLNILDRATGKFKHYIPDEKDSSSILNTDIRAIFEDTFGELWFGGDYLEKLNRKDTSFTYYLKDPSSKSDLNLSEIWSIAEDDSTNLWLSSKDGGLFKMNRKSMTFTALTTDHGLPSNTINSIEIDDRGFIWASTNQGLSRVDPHDYSIRNFDIEDGLVSQEFIGKSSFKDDEGWLYFGSRNGFNVFHPDSIKENKIIPPVYITTLTVAGKQKYFDKPLYELSDIDLEYDENDFSFDFVALNYVNAQKNQYAYMLEGYDEDWNYVGNRRTAYYTNLNPGKYNFRVKGSNNDGYWNEQGANISMVIYPPIWKTWWAYMIYALIFMVLVYILRRNELRKINLRQELQLKQVQAEQLAELDIEKNKFFSNISHEFRTPLTLILGPLDRFIGKLVNEDQKQELNLVKRNALRLQTLINQLLSLSKLESGKMKLKTRPENIVKLTSLFVKSFHSMAEERGISLDFESDSEEYMVYIDTLKFEKIANNLLSNAFKFTEKGGCIKVAVLSSQSAVGSQQSAIRSPQYSVGSYQSDNRTSSTEDWRLKTEDWRLPTGDYIKIKFSDTGRGIKQEDLLHIFDRFYQVDETQMKTNLGTGIGLALTKELVALHHGTITAESEPDRGTTFTVFLPTGKDHLAEDEIIESGAIKAQTEDDLLNDDYLFAEDVPTITNSQIKAPLNSDLPIILIVEDNDDMRSYIKSYLVDSYNIIEAHNGQQGAEQATEHIPDLIISDLMMPKLDGNEMTHKLKTDERTSHIPIILLTAKASKESKLAGLETGADDFLTKPFDAEELLVRIKNLIEQRRRLKKLVSQHIGDVFQIHIIDEATGRGIKKIDEQFLEKATNVIDTRMADPEFSVEILAGEMAMSQMQLYRKLKGLTDLSASDFIRQLRLMKAAKLIKEGELNITQVSYEIGIYSPSYFAKAFKEKFGVTPSDYT